MRGLPTLIIGGRVMGLSKASLNLPQHRRFIELPFSFAIPSAIHLHTYHSRLRASPVKALTA